MEAKNVALLGALGAGAYFLLREPAAPPRAPRAVILPPAPKGRGPWRMKEADCIRDRCTLNYQNPSISPTGWLYAEVTREAFDKMPQRTTIAGLKKRRGVLSVERWGD